MHRSQNRFAPELYTRSTSSDVSFFCKVVYHIVHTMFIMKVPFLKKKKKSILPFESPWFAPLLLIIGVLIGVSIVWVTYFSWEELSRSFPRPCASPIGWYQGL